MPAVCDGAAAEGDAGESGGGEREGETELHRIPLGLFHGEVVPAPREGSVRATSGERKIARAEAHPRAVTESVQNRHTCVAIWRTSRRYRLHRGRREHP